MAMEKSARKTEHSGAKNGDKRGKRAIVKSASKKFRRVNDRVESKRGSQITP